jgi:hypothetical protein
MGDQKMEWKGGESSMGKKMIALFVSMAFAFGVVGYAAAQTSTAPAPSTEKKDDMKMDSKKADKKGAKVDKKADCLQKAGTDDAKKADCEKKYPAKKSAAKKDTSAEKKTDDKK